MRVLGQPLQGLTVGVPESRYSEEFGRLFERAGAQVRFCPLMTEEIVEDRSSIQDFIDRAIDGQFDVVIFMTGIGASLIFNEAEAAGRRHPLLSALSKVIIVSRGSKSASALKKKGVRVDWIPDAATSEGLIEMFRQRQIASRRVALQLYGTANPQLTEGLRRLGAQVSPVSVYTYREVSTPAVVASLIRELIAGEIQVIAFTSAAQVVTLLETARKMGLLETLIDALRDRMHVASIGEVTTRALSTYGIRPHIVPEEPRMGPMVQIICTTLSS